MFDSTKAVIDKYNAMSDIQRKRFLGNASAGELEILADYPELIKPAVPADGHRDGLSGYADMARRRFNFKQGEEE